MSAVSEIEAAVAKLSRQDLSAFRDWPSQFYAAAWDRQLEADVAAGHLDALADEALRDLHEGRCRDLRRTAPIRGSGNTTRSSPRPSSGWRMKTTRCSKPTRRTIPCTSDEIRIEPQPLAVVASGERHKIQSDVATPIP